MFLYVYMLGSMRIQCCIMQALEVIRRVVIDEQLIALKMMRNEFTYGQMMNDSLKYKYIVHCLSKNISYC